MTADQLTTNPYCEFQHELSDQRTQVLVLVWGIAYETPEGYETDLEELRVYKILDPLDINSAYQQLLFSALPAADQDDLEYEARDRLTDIEWH